MPDLKRYWREIREVGESLPESLWMVSLEDVMRGQVGGAMVEVGAVVGAKLLAARTHRVATEEEVRAHEVGVEGVKKVAVEEGLRKVGRVVVGVRG